MQIVIVLTLLIYISNCPIDSVSKVNYVSYFLDSI
jgi:hypothetical protein